MKSFISKTSIILLSIILSLGSNVSYALPIINNFNNKTLSDSGVTWTFPSTFKIPKSGCKNITFKYKVKIPGRDTYTTIKLENNFGDAVAYERVVVATRGKSGSLKLKVCAEDYCAAGLTLCDPGDGFFRAGARKGTIDVVTQTVAEYDGNSLNSGYLYSESTGSIKFLK